MKIKKEASCKAKEAQRQLLLAEIVWCRSCRRGCATKAAAVRGQQAAYSTIKEINSSMCLASKAELIT